MPPRSPDRQLWTIVDVADRLGCHPDTVRRWIRKGAMRYVRVGPFGRIRITELELRKHLRIGSPTS